MEDRQRSGTSHEIKELWKRKEASNEIDKIWKIRKDEYHHFSKLDQCTSLFPSAVFYFTTYLKSEIEYARGIFNE